MGEIACEEWKNTEKLRNNVISDEWVIMPNHIHGIIIIDNECADAGALSRRSAQTPRDALQCVSTTIINISCQI